MASTTLDLPQPLGPMMHVTPLPLKTICVFSQKDLKPSNSTLRSLSTLLLRNSLALPFDARKQPEFCNCQQRILRQKSWRVAVCGPSRLAHQIGGDAEEDSMGPKACKAFGRGMCPNVALWENR
jgi:hypothetical protein